MRKSVQPTGQEGRALRRWQIGGSSVLEAQELEPDPVGVNPEPTLG